MVRLLSSIARIKVDGFKSKFKSSDESESDVGSSYPAIISSSNSHSKSKQIHLQTPRFPSHDKMYKRRDPTMERSTIEEKVTGGKLEQVYEDLEEEWNRVKKLKLRGLRRYSTVSNIMVKTLPLLDNSPRSLMSSLQHPSDEVAWKVRNNDLAVIEILRERRAAIESGKLKGRRLFEDVEVVTEVGFGRREEICNGWNGLNQAFEIRSMSSYDSDDEEGVGGNDEELPVCYQCGSYTSSSSSSSLCGEIAESEVKQGEKAIAEAECKRGVSRGRWMAGFAWLALALFVCAVGITSVTSFGRYRDENNEVILVPT